MSKIKLNPSCIFALPLQTYETDFTFYVNGKEFKTNRIISDLISPTICILHSNDPTLSAFTMNTINNGDFSKILSLLKSEELSIQPSELPFFREVVEKLGNGSIELFDATDTAEITCENVFDLVMHHEKVCDVYSKRFLSEIEFISSHFFELCESCESELACLSTDTLLRIVGDEHLALDSEDQLLKFVNSLCRRDSENSVLYESVRFENVTSDGMREFTSVFDVSCMTGGTWMSLRRRLDEDVAIRSKKCSEDQRYKANLNVKGGCVFAASDQKPFNGILNFLSSKSNDGIENEITITSSGALNSSENLQPRNVVLFDDKSRYFYSSNVKNSWICFDFNKRRVVPTEYTIRSYDCDKNYNHPKSWVIECSNDKESWEIVDEENDCQHLNGRRVVHTFQMNKPTSKEFRFIRMRITGQSWWNYNQLVIDSFEIYGKLI